MAQVGTVGNKEDFIVQMNGDYNLPFDEVEVSVAATSGTVLENGGKVADDGSMAVLGILAEDTDGTGFVRVMVRGNPTTVNQQAITNWEDGFQELLEEVGIVVVNK